MKKSLKILLMMLLTTIVLTACANDGQLNQVGIAPYQLTDQNKDLLQVLGIADNVAVFNFKAPDEAIDLELNVYHLSADGTWQNDLAGRISIGEEREPVDQLAGTLAVLLKENRSFDININCGGGMVYRVDPLDSAQEYMASAKMFLSDAQAIEINQEIPIALLLYDNNTEIRSYSLSDYFAPSIFEGVDSVQVITVNFRNSAA